MKILFICSRNIWRSATAEAIYKNSQDHEFRSAGTEPSAKVRVSAKSIAWADLIFVMEKKHKHRLVDKFPGEMAGKQVIVLDIEDQYQFMNEELIEMIRISIDPYL